MEHPVTEMISGVNLPATQTLIGMGVPLHRIPDVRRLFGQAPDGTGPIDFDKTPAMPPLGDPCMEAHRSCREVFYPGLSALGAPHMHRRLDNRRHGSSCCRELLACLHSFDCVWCQMQKTLVPCLNQSESQPDAAAPRNNDLAPLVVDMNRVGEHHSQGTWWPAASPPRTPTTDSSPPAG